jgi:hypothetical protein
MVDLLQETVRFDRNNVDGYTITFHYFQRTDSGGSIGRYLDNAPSDPWDMDEGFTDVEQKIMLPCTYIPSVEQVNLVQESYHPDSEIEVMIDRDSIYDHSLTVNDLRNRFEYATIPEMHQVLIGGRPCNTTNQLWDIRSVREKSIANRLIAVVVGLSLREPDEADVAAGDIIA